MSNKSFGTVGEIIACKYLIKNNYQIIDKNFFFKGGEIDIIAIDKTKKEIVFFEVKTRANKKYGNASEAVDSTKIKHILRGIKIYLCDKRWENRYVRVDVLELYYIRATDTFYINHIKQAI